MYRQIIYPRRRLLDGFGFLNASLESKGATGSPFCCHYGFVSSYKNEFLHTNTKDVIRFVAREKNKLSVQTRPFSVMSSPLSLGRASTLSSITSSSGCIDRNNNIGFFSIFHQQHKQQPHNQMPSRSPNYNSVAYFSRSRQNRRPPSNKSGIRNTIGMIGTGALVLFGKTKYVLAALKLTKLAPLGSMIITVGTYSMFFGLPYAAGMVGLILVHEIGHAAVMHAKGVPFSPMVFIPFMGAVIATKELPRDAWEDALIAFGGPVLGSLGAGAVGLAGHATDSQLLIALADFGFMINMFNLLPLGSMDGGRIAGALSPYMSIAGVGMGAGLAYTGAIQNPLFYLILLSGGYQTFQRFYNPGSMPPNYYAISSTQRAALGLGYVGLISGLALAMDLNARNKKSPEVLKREMELEKMWDMR
mmetsp:Transcript_16825/g.38861  ORF Transcript_16825/g.38861 Transcript_16825/m.38861 type:complete len:417 (-) Transcript_16825:12-1262(-)